MKLKIALDEKMMDLRLRDRLLAEGKITQADVDKFLSNLDDESGKFETATEE